MPRTMREAKRTPCDDRDVDFLQFSALSQEQIINYSVVEIYVDHFYENQMPARGGLFDLRLGISGPNQICETCGQSTQCPGHFGHIKLSEPVYHYGFLWVVAQLMKCICLRCFRLKRGQAKQLGKKIKQAKRIINPFKKLAQMCKLLGNIKKCSKKPEEEDLFDSNFKCCNSWIPTKIGIKNYQITYVDDENKQRVFQRRQIKAALEGLSAHESQCEALGFTKTKPIDLIIQSLAVCPPQIRPYILIQYETKCEDDLSNAYLKVLRLNKSLKSTSLNLIQKGELTDQMERVIASIMINLKANPQSKPQKKPSHRIKNISQRLKGKQGRFRNNLLGKRVDFSARTVISPDPNIALSQVGVPEKIARNLTYPEKVTQLNFNKILNLLVQKRVKYLITRPEVGLGNQERILNVNKIQATTKEQFKQYLSSGMIAERMLQNGDYVLLNRQPTLHRMSMMAHKVRILPNQTFRINLSVCTPYNADFDGDQMNLHVPQSYQTVAELKNVASVQGQIVGPKNGTTSMGFSQDSLLGSYLMTSRDTFLTRSDFMNLIAKLNEHELKIGTLPMPAILKPEPLWTGKQLVSLLLPEQVDMKKIGHTPKQMALRNIQDLNLVIRKGQLLTGVLQKEHIGACSSANNIIHFIWTQIGAGQAQQFINDLQQVAYNWLMDTGFSIGASDVVPESAIFKKKSAEFAQLQNLYYSLFNSFRDKNEVKKNHLHQQGQLIFESLEYLINLKLNNHLSKIQEEVKRSMIGRKNNNIYKIIQVKSKGSQTNLAQILYSVGNQNINGKRCPIGFLKRSLPHYSKSDNSPAARGYVLSSYYEGLNPQQFFFHSMGGREGLSDTAVKTSSVGYIQRKLVKSLQDLIIKYDGSVRDSRENILQHLYGEDGFSPQLIERHYCSGAEFSPKIFRQKYKWKQQQLKKNFRYNGSQIQALQKQYIYLQKNRKMFRRYFSSNSECKNYTYFCPITVQKVIKKIKFQKPSKITTKIDPLQVYKSVEQLLREINILPRKFKILPRIVHDSRKQNEENQSFSDQFQREDINKDKQMAVDYLNPSKKKIKPQQQFDIFQMHLRFSLSSKVLHKLYCLDRQELKKLIEQIKGRFFKSLVPAGESVGCLASQCIGQPTTQMTLNTFHLAGISDRNVTLGVPRLEQILNCPTSFGDSTLILFPRKPVPESESKDPQNQQYLLNLLFGTLPEVKIGHFVESSHFNYNPRELNQKKQLATKMAKQSIRTPWTITLNFTSSQIHTHQMWERILDTVRRKAQTTFDIDDVIDYSESLENPRIVMRYRHKMDTDETKRKNLISFFEQQQAEIKDTRLGGIVGLKGVRLTKKLLKLDDESGWKQYIAFQVTGKSLKDCLSHPEINSYRSYSDNAQQVASVLGIEAARQTIFKQLKQVLRPYGISINYKHLSILVDWMCMQGVLTPVNRHGLHRSKNLSTLTKASFERAVDVLFNAAIFSQKNAISNNSQKIIFGKMAQCGTAQCEIMIDPTKSAMYATKQQQCRAKMVLGEGEATQIKTPEYSESPTLANSILSGVKSPYGGAYSYRSPLNPTMGFSPLVSPIYNNNNQGMISPMYNNNNQGMISPTYRNTMPKIDPKRIEYAGRYNSPGYDRFSSSPSYSELVNSRYSTSTERKQPFVPEVKNIDSQDSDQ